MELTRRKFLEFMGRSALAMGTMPVWSGCTTTSKSTLPFKSLKPTTADKVILADGFDHSILIQWGDTINKAGQPFGFNNDFLACMPIAESSTGDFVLWVNHESPDPLFLTGGYHKGIGRTKQQVIKEQSIVGGSLVRVMKNSVTGRYEWVKNDPLNRRLDATTKIPFKWPHSIAGAKAAVGTLANCAGGTTPWGTVLTCEENSENFFGILRIDEKGNRTISPSYIDYGWNKFFDYPPEHYSWVVEVNPMTGDAHKLVSLGRFAHECATVTVGSTGQAIVYSGDDLSGGCLYKFISKKPNDLSEGTLFAADFKAGRWIPLDRERTPSLKERFKSQTELLIQTRTAASLVGATPLDRPEDIEIDPATKAVFVTQTNNKATSNFYGSVTKIVEKNGDPLSLTFESSTFLAGGTESGFACPDNLVFDARGNLWFTSDISGHEAGSREYKPFGNNGLFYVPLSGRDAGRVFKVASAPFGAEFTGPVFTPDGKTLLLAVQHPGEDSVFPDVVTSHWPDGGTSLPRPAVIAISGPSLDKLLS
jgi:uncharacterized protein